MQSQVELADLGLSPLLQGDQRPVFSFTWHINWCQSSLTHFSQNGSQALSLSKQPFKTCFARRAALSLQPLMDPCARASVQLGAPCWLQPRGPFPNFWTSATSLRSLIPSCHPAPQQLGMWRGSLTPCFSAPQQHLLPNTFPPNHDSFTGVATYFSFGILSTTNLAKYIYTHTYICWHLQKWRTSWSCHNL